MIRVSSGKTLTKLEYFLRIELYAKTSSGSPHQEYSHLSWDGRGGASRTPERPDRAQIRRGGELSYRASHAHLCRELPLEDLQITDLVYSMNALHSCLGQLLRNPVYWRSAMHQAGVGKPAGFEGRSGHEAWSYNGYLRPVRRQLWAANVPRSVAGCLICVRALEDNWDEHGQICET